MGKALGQRTCIGCRSVKGKHEMLRLFKSCDGDVLIDMRGNMPGRGAYICSLNCLETALSRNLIGRALRVRFPNKIDDEEKAMIESFFSSTNSETCKE